MRKVIVIFVLIVIICGCGSEKMEGKERMMNQAAEEFQRLMDEDQIGDQQSVNWNGMIAEKMWDPFDDLECLDGYHVYTYENVKKDTWSVELICRRDKQVMLDEAEHYLAKGKDWKVEICKEEELQKDRFIWIQEISVDEVPQQILERNQNAVLYRGLQKDDKEVKAGYLLLLQDLDGEDWQLSYFAIGNMMEIKESAMTIFKNFRKRY